MLSKKIMCGVAVLGTAVALNAYAVQPGFYMGGQLGWGKVHQDTITNHDLNAITTSGLGYNNYTVKSYSESSSDSGLAGRLFGGYQINETWGAELGWSKFKNMTTKASDKGVDNVNGLPFSSSASGTVKTDAIDLVAKATYPIQNNINVYGKLGAAYLMQRANASAALSEPGFKVAGSGSDNEHKVYPTFGVGASYEFTQNVAADLSWNRIQKVGNSKKMSSTDFVGVGLIYSIG